MSLTGGYGEVDYHDALDVLVSAVDAGAALLDTADVYPGGESLVATALAARPGHRVQVATKIGLTGEPGARVPCGRPDYLRDACEASLRRLRTDAVDVLLLHRVDRHVPVEESVGALDELVVAGKARNIGICTASPEILRRAHAERPLTFVQTEFSLLEPQPARQLLPLAHSLHLTLMAHSPLRRGLLARRDLPLRFEPDDARAYIEHTRDAHQRAIADAFHELAIELGVAPVRLALGWLLSLGTSVVPLPGARTRTQVRANLHSQVGPLPADQARAVSAFIEEQFFDVTPTARSDGRTLLKHCEG